ncbi:MAG TPA: hypothetical protein VEW93_02710 [Acidimicrobiales bacterium]|nr:hypothetical protein [Acidimicrobiales bacterium]
MTDIVTIGRGKAPPAKVASAREHSVRLGAHRYPVLLPSLHDPRLHVAGVLLSVQVLGQTVLGFELSIAQILLSLGTCAVLELGITFAYRRVIAWPASALLTGNGVALLLRTAGTEHGDWWSLDGWHIWVATAGVSLLSKYVIRYRGEHVFNPSNIGLLIVFVVVGTRHANPQDLWWGPWSPGLVLTYAVIVGGGVAITRRLHLLAAAATFWVTYAGIVAVVAASGHAMTARWHIGAVEGFDYWWALVGSPEILIFLFFMITDPKTAPQGRVARLVFAATVGAMSSILASGFATEFSTKVAIIGGLVLVCGLRPLVERWLPRAGSESDRLRSWFRPARVVSTGAVAVLALGAALAVTAVTPEVDPPRAVNFAGRPVVELPLGAVPAVTLGEGTDVISALTDDVAASMARDLVEGLVIEADALRRGDADLAATAVSGPRIEEVRAALAAGGPVEVSTYTFTALELVIARADTTPQAAALFAFEVEGTVAVDWIDDGHLVRTSAPAPVRGRFVLEPGGDHQLIGSFDPAP